MVRTICLAAAVLSILGGAASARSLTPGDAGSFVRDPHGVIIGSLKAIDGDHAVIWYGFVNTPGNHIARVAADQIAAGPGGLTMMGNADTMVASR